MKWTQVVAGIIVNEKGQVLLSSRPKGKACAGFWEFAGGKMEPGESEFSALQREIFEELNLRITRATLWLTKTHHYLHANVQVRFFRVAAGDFTGEAAGLEGQELMWYDLTQSLSVPVLPANTAILEALKLPAMLAGSLEKGLYSQNGNMIFSPDDITKTWQWCKTFDEALLATVQVAVYEVKTLAEIEKLNEIINLGVSIPLFAAASRNFWQQHENAWAHGKVVLT